jgi:COP9 signalosome complex subunit 1
MQMQASLIEESMRISYKDIGDFYCSHGHLYKVLRSYMRLNEYSTTSMHTIGLCMHVILLSIELGQFDYVISYVSKVEETANTLDIITTSKLRLRAASGLACMQTEKYELAANKVCHPQIMLS